MSDSNDTVNTSYLGNRNDTFQASGSVNRDIKMIQFVPEADPLLNGPKWEKWIDEFNTRLRYFRVTDDQDKLDALKIYGGKEIRDKIKLLRDPEPDSDDSSDTELEVSTTPYGKAIAKLSKHYIGLKSVPHARFRFGKLRQKDGETINEYEVRLREAATDCEFLDMDGQILYHLSLTIKDSDFRRKAMDKKYSLQKFLLKAQSKEDTYRRAEEIEANEERAVNRVQSYKPRPNHRRKQHRSNNRHHQQSTQPSYSLNKQIDCPHCDVDHPSGRWNCPASGVRCDNCGGKGHYAVKCLKPKSHTQHSFSHRKSSNYQSNKHRQTHVKQIFEESETDEECVYKVGIPKSSQENYSSIVKIYVNGIKVQFEVDTGASSNLIDEDRFEKIQEKLDPDNRLELKPTNVKLLTYGDYMIPVIGYFETIVASKQSKALKAKFLVVKGSVRSSPLLSLQTSVDLGLISFNYQVQTTSEKPSETIDSILQQYNDIFTG
ncbi:hypothetical protein SNE40_004901 [Patella caerulea]|uniref:CCHC-type domain-containing protein n=2 Tax=Patella caerulea TaxID=87958 RepID=A0AAN8Q646_PATCE